MRLTSQLFALLATLILFFPSAPQPAVHSQYILTAALSVQQHQLDPFHAALIGEWIRWSWEGLLDELVDQLSQGLH